MTDETTDERGDAEVFQIADEQARRAYDEGTLLEQDGLVVDPPDEGDADPADEGDTFTADYVAELRTEAANYRKRLREAEAGGEQWAAEVFRLRLESLDVLADPTDLPVDLSLLETPDGLRDAALALVADKPHLRSRGIRSRAGQGEGAADEGEVSLTSLLRGGA